jgi:hypothetical protein
LNKAITDGGFSTRKTLKYLAEQGIIEAFTENGSVRYSVQRRFQGGRARFVKILLDQLEAGKEERNCDRSSESVTTNYTFDGFTEVDDDEDLPF